MAFTIEVSDAISIIPREIISTILVSNYGSKSLKTLLEKCSNTELFLVRIFLYSDWRRRFSLQPEYSPYSVQIQENTDQK